MSLKRESFWGRLKAPIIVCMGALLTGLISFMITVKIYDNNENKDKKIVIPNKVISSLSGEKINDNIVVKVEDEIDNKKLNEFEVIEESSVSTTEEFNGEEINVVEITKEDYNEFINFLAKNDEKNFENQVIETIANVEKSSGENEEEKLEFIMPLDGEIGMNYATEKLIYSNTLEEWITHNGIDIIGEEAEPIKVIEDGVVESIKMDPRYGNTIIIKHNEMYKSIYSNLSTTDLVYVGKKVEKGEIISGVGKGFGFESKEEPHIHLTILENGEIVNPGNLIKN